MLDNFLGGVYEPRRSQGPRGQCSAILTEQAWSIKDLLHGLREKCFLCHTAGSPRRRFVRSSSQSPRKIWFMLPALEASHIKIQNRWTKIDTQRFQQDPEAKYFFHVSARIYENLVTCQGERVKLHCGNASLGLTIHSASYGRTYPGYVICPYRGAEDDKDYNCGESDVTDTFKTLCAKKNRCRVKVNSALFRDPRPQKHLYLTLIYSCGKYLIF